MTVAPVRAGLPLEDARGFVVLLQCYEHRVSSPCLKIPAFSTRDLGDRTADRNPRNDPIETGRDDGGERADR